MKYYLFAGLAVTALTINNLESKVIEQSLSEQITFEYTELEKRDDSSPKLYVIQNPKLKITDSENPSQVGEIFLDGTLTLSHEAKDDFRLNATGTLHLRTSEEGPVGNISMAKEATIKGSLNGTLNANQEAFRSSLERMKQGDTSEQTILALLESLRKISVEGKDLEIRSNSQNKDPNTVIDSLNFNYAHTNGNQPEEISLQVTATMPQLVSSEAIYRIPGATPGKSNSNLKINLPEWRKLVIFARNPKETAIPNISLTFDSDGKSDLANATSSGSFNSDLSEGNHKLEGKVKYALQASSDWVQKIQKLERQPLLNQATSEKTDQENFEETVYNWIVSPKTTPFLSMLPLKVNFDWDGSLNYSAAQGIGTVNTKYSLLGKEVGINGTMTYALHQFKSEMDIVGGRPTYDYAVNLYNTFNHSIDPNWGLPKISKEAQEEFFKMISEFADQPEETNKKLHFTFTYDDHGARLGKRPIARLVAELAEFYQRHFSKENGVLLTTPDANQPEK